MKTVIELLEKEKKKLSNKIKKMYQERNSRPTRAIFTYYKEKIEREELKFKEIQAAIEVLSLVKGEQNE